MTRGKRKSAPETLLTEGTGKVKEVGPEAFIGEKRREGQYAAGEKKLLISYGGGEDRVE